MTHHYEIKSLKHGNTGHILFKYPSNINEMSQNLKTLNYMEMINDGVVGEVEKILQK